MGLAEPVVANRFGLWCIWTGGLTWCLGFVLLTRILARAFEVGIERLPEAFQAAQITILASIVVSMTAIWLSFFPPSRYLDWIERRASEVAA